MRVGDVIHINVSITPKGGQGVGIGAKAEVVSYNPKLEEFSVDVFLGSDETPKRIERRNLSDVVEITAYRLARRLESEASGG